METLANDSSVGAWQWQMANRITTREQLENYIRLTDHERAAFEGERSLPFAITPYYANMLEHAALRKTIVPSGRERETACGELEDPLGEEDHRVTPNLIHTYPDKVLLLVTTLCPVYCRYCTRARLIGTPRNVDNASSFVASSTRKPKTKPEVSSTFEESFQYIEQNTEIRDVLISGGDPLTMTDPVLERLLSRLRSIPHVRMIRIGSKVPAVLPMRITDELCAILRKHGVWLSLHFTHAAELTQKTRDACLKLSDHGVPMVSQTVLLKGVNDDTQALINLFYGLLEIHVKPYYLLQCDPVNGSARFRTPVRKGVELIRSLHGTVSGLAVPQFVIDAPGGGGKIPILSVEQLRQRGEYVELINHEGHTYRYPDVPGET